MEERIKIDYIAHEADMARMERAVKRFATLCIIELVIILIFGTIMGYMFYYESQFEDVVTTETVTQESDAKDGGTAIVNNGGDVIYGESQTDTDTNDKDSP